MGNKGRMRDHESNHLLKKKLNFPCSICSFSAQNLSLLEKHQMLHSEYQNIKIEKFECESCTESESESISSSHSSSDFLSTGYDSESSEIQKNVANECKDISIVNLYNRLFDESKTLKLESSHTTIKREPEFLTNSLLQQIELSQSEQIIKSKRLQIIKVENESKLKEERMQRMKKQKEHKTSAKITEFFCKECDKIFVSPTLFQSHRFRPDLNV